MPLSPRCLCITLFLSLLFTRSQAQIHAYFPVTTANNVKVINISTNAVDATISVGSGPRGVWVLPNGAKTYVANYSSNTVSVINNLTNTVIATIPVGSSPFPVAGTPDGSTVYVGNLISNTISVISTATNTVTATIAVSTPYGMDVTPDGTTLYSVNDGDNTVSIINTATNTITGTIPVGSSPYYLAVSPDGSKVYVANQSSHSVSVISTATNTVIATISLGAGTYPIGITPSPDGTKVYVCELFGSAIAVINTATNLVTATIPVSGQPICVSFTPDGTKGFVGMQSVSYVTVINPLTNTVTGTITTGGNPLGYGHAIQKSATALPLSLLDFSISPNGSIVTALWHTAAEDRVSHFNLQKSEDAAQFSTVQMLPSAGAGAHSYSVKDDNSVTVSKEIYYRLELVDMDGTKTYSPLRSCTIEASGFQLTLFPNPAKDLLTINFSSDKEQSYTLQCTDLSGRIVLQQELQAHSGSNQASLDLHTVNPGVYVLQVFEEERLVGTVKVVKE